MRDDKYECSIKILEEALSANNPKKRKLRYVDLLKTVKKLKTENSNLRSQVDVLKKETLENSSLRSQVHVLREERLALLKEIDELEMWTADIVLTEAKMSEGESQNPSM